MVELLKGKCKCGSRVVGGPDPTWKITMPKGSLVILVRIVWKIIKISSQHSMFGHHRPASKMAFKWCFHWWANGGPLLVVCGSIFPLKNQNKTLSELQLALPDPPMTCQSNKGDIRKSHTRVCIYVNTCLKAHI